MLHQVSVSFDLDAAPALIRRCDDLPATITHVFHLTYTVMHGSTKLKSSVSISINNSTCLRDLYMHVRRSMETCVSGKKQLVTALNAPYQ